MGVKPIRGTAFIILNKAKGWWVVQKDHGGSGDTLVDKSQSGWVPAGESFVFWAHTLSARGGRRSHSTLLILGCLLEVSHPIGPSVGTNRSDVAPLARTPISPGSIISSSFQGVVLMDYEAGGEDELPLKKDEQLRVL